MSEMSEVKKIVCYQVYNISKGAFIIFSATENAAALKKNKNCELPFRKIILIQFDN